MGREVEGDEELEEQGPLRVRESQEHLQACRRTSTDRVSVILRQPDRVPGHQVRTSEGWGRGEGIPVSDHIEDSTKLGRLVERPRCLAVYSVEDTRDKVEDRADFRVDGHVVQRCAGGEHTDITNEVGDEEEHILVYPERSSAPILI